MADLLPHQFGKSGFVIAWLTEQARLGHGVLIVATLPKSPKTDDLNGAK